METSNFSGCRINAVKTESDLPTAPLHDGRSTPGASSHTRGMWPVPSPPVERNLLRGPPFEKTGRKQRPETGPVKEDLCSMARILRRNASLPLKLQATQTFRMVQEFEAWVTLLTSKSCRDVTVATPVSPQENEGDPPARLHGPLVTLLPAKTARNAGRQHENHCLGTASADQPAHRGWGDHGRHKFHGIWADPFRLGPSRHGADQLYGARAGYVRV